MKSKLPIRLSPKYLGLTVLTVLTCCPLNHVKCTRIELKNVIRLVVDKK